MSVPTKNNYLKLSVYLLTLCQLVVGLIHLFQGIVHLHGFLIVLGITELILASLLIYGIVLNNETAIMIYLILGVFSVITLTLRVLLLLVEGTNHEPDEVVVFIILALLLAWSAQFSIYSYYRVMVASNRTLAALSRNVVVSPELVVYDSNEFDKEGPTQNTAV